MATLSNNDIAQATFELLKEKGEAEHAHVFRDVAQFLFKKRLLSRAPQIIEKLEKIIYEKEGVVKARVSSVKSLENETKSKLKDFLKKRYEANEVIIEEKVDGGLIGGVKIEINDETIDLSYKNRISKLQAHLTKD